MEKETIGKQKTIRIAIQTAAKKVGMINNENRKNKTNGWLNKECKKKITKVWRSLTKFI